LTSNGKPICAILDEFNFHKASERVKLFILARNALKACAVVLVLIGTNSLVANFIESNGLLLREKYDKEDKNKVELKDKMLIFVFFKLPKVNENSFNKLIQTITPEDVFEDFKDYFFPLIAESTKNLRWDSFKRNYFIFISETLIRKREYCQEIHLGDVLNIFSLVTKS
jgi:hypothetical protein